jgi:CHAD domain-containing protein
MTESIENVKPGLDTPFRVAARAAVDKAMAEIEANWNGALSGDDVEAVHDLRVGTRRMRAALSVYEGAFSPAEFRRAERAMSELTDALGPARDTDVLIEHIEAVLAGLADADEAERVGLRYYIEHLKQLRARQQIALDKTLSKIDIQEVAMTLEAGCARIDD